MIENRRGYSISFRLVLVIALIIASGIIIYHLYIPDEDGLDLSGDDSPPELIQLRVDEQNYTDNMNFTHHEKIDIRFNFYDDSEFKEAYVNVSSPTDRQQLALNVTGDQCNFSYQLEEVGEYVFSPVLVDEHGNQANTTLKILSEDNPPTIDLSKVKVQERLGRYAYPGEPVRLLLSVEDDTFDHKKPEVVATVKNIFESYQIPLEPGGSLYTGEFNHTGVPGKYEVLFKAVDEMNHTSTATESFVSGVDVDLSELKEVGYKSEFIEGNPFLWEYIKDGQLDDYEETVLEKAGKQGDLALDVLRMPEVYSKEIDLEDITNYVNFVEKIHSVDDGAARWVLETGLFLEDKKFNKVEQEFVDQSLSKDDLLRLYVSDFVMGGIQRTPHLSANVDGNSKDWQGIKPLMLDPEGDSRFNISGTDVEAVYSAVDDENLYLMVKTYAKANPKNRYVFDIKNGLSNFHLQFEPDDSINLWIDGKLDDSYGVSAARGDVVEIRISLNLLGNPSKIKIGSFVDYSDKGHTDFINSFYISILDDFQKLEGYKTAVNGELLYFEDDLSNLPEIADGINEREQEAISKLAQIVNTSKEDYQLRKGINLIDEYGVPDQSLFSFSVPNYNTQLKVLFNLAKDRDIPKDYYRIALALGMDYGSIITIGDKGVDQEVRKYVSQLFDFIKETDEIIKQYDADWQVKDYPLEADIGLVWGASGLKYPSLARDPDWESWHNWYYNKNLKNGISLPDFYFVFTDVSNMREMREWMINKFLTIKKPTGVNMPYESFQREFPLCYNNKVDEVAADLDDYMTVNGEHFDVRDGHGVLNIEGFSVKDNGISNVDWQWEHLKEKGTIIGHCVDNGQVLSDLLKSINIAAIIGDYQHAFPMHYNNEDATWRVNPYEAKVPKDLVKKHGVFYQYHRIPYDNGYRMPFDDIRYGLFYSYDRAAYANGIPTGYILRKHTKFI